NTSTVTFNGPAGVQTLDSGASSFSNLIHSGAGTLELATNPLNVTGPLMVTAGTLDALSQNLSVTGLTTISGATLTNTGNLNTLALGGGLSMTGGKLSSGLGTAVLTGDVTAISDATGPALISGKLNLGSTIHNFMISRGPQATDLTIAATIIDAGMATP